MVFCNKLEAEARKIDDSIQITNREGSINFGPKAEFESNEHIIEPDGQKPLRDFTPKLLSVGNSEEGKKWFKRVLVTGYTDKPDHIYITWA